MPPSRLICCALEEDPNYADALHALAMTYAHQEKFDEAIEAGKRLIEVAPDDELAYTSLSIFYQKKGLIAEAEQIAAKARTLSWKRELRDQQRVRQRLNHAPLHFVRYFFSALALQVGFYNFHFFSSTWRDCAQNSPIFTRLRLFSWVLAVWDRTR